MTTYTYLRVQVDNGNSRLGDELSFRKYIQDALVQSFGLSGAGTYVDVLRFRPGITRTHAHAHAAATANPNDAGRARREVLDAVIRVAREDAPRIKAALASAAPVRLAVVDEANFLPALLASESEPLPLPESGLH